MSEEQLTLPSEQNGAAPVRGLTELETGMRNAVAIKELAKTMQGHGLLRPVTAGLVAISANVAELQDRAMGSCEDLLTRLGQLTAMVDDLQEKIESMNARLVVLETAAKKKKGGK